ncbi:hypothetical protein A8139_05630 [Marinomonas primoryensis]|uniref:Uncharacterized protein n=1 Tax=Marinomonas primoryensis TaxID=178399 RepID=A0A2Z4PPT9_9GAMM|nr:hypothetical protein [Marinomonas primoryensis]AWX99531.1 hypothetical protein A8139_05630 [Marinomonas primoryensis]
MSDMSKDIRTHRSPDGNVWHCARDVYKSMGITWSGATIRNTQPNHRTMYPVDTPKGERLAVFISDEEMDFLQKHRSK